MLIEKEDYQKICLGAGYMGDVSQRIYDDNDSGIKEAVHSEDAELFCQVMERYANEYVSSFNAIEAGNNKVSTRAIDYILFVWAVMTDIHESHKVEKPLMLFEFV